MCLGAADRTCLLASCRPSLHDPTNQSGESPDRQPTRGLPVWPPPHCIAVDDSSATLASSRALCRSFRRFHLISDSPYRSYSSFTEGATRRHHSSIRGAVHRMRQRPWTVSLFALLGIARSAAAYKSFSNYSVAEAPSSLFSIYGDRPDGCPPCFNCNLEDFKCHQFAECTKASGRCSCPPGFGGEDCSEPLCGALPDGKDRAPRGSEQECQCRDGWTGINCNVCETNDACNAMMPDGQGGVCYKDGQLVKENFQMCDITNRKILDQLKDKKPQATFSCNSETAECNFQCTSMNLLITTLANKHSLGRPARILLLRPRHVYRRMDRRGRPQHHPIPMRKHPVRLHTGPHAMWRSGLNRYW